MTNIFSELKNMNRELSNALSTMLLRRLDIFLHFETYVLENSKKPPLCRKSGPQLDFLPHIYITRQGKQGGGFHVFKPFDHIFYYISDF